LWYNRGMGRPLRTTAGGMVYHVLNRANARMPIFEKAEDYDAFERILDEAVRRVRMRLLAYCAMPDHWHMVLWPREGGDLSAFVGWLTLTHTQRWHAHRHSEGPPRSQALPGNEGVLVESDEHLWTVCRYVERNALRAGLCARAEEWR
jgi:putative transposase